MLGIYHLTREISKLIWEINQSRRFIVSSIDNLNTNISKLATDVEALIAKPSTGVDEAQVQSAADNLAALDEKVVAALTPPTP